MTNFQHILISIFATLITAWTLLLAVTLAVSAHPDHASHCHIDISRCH